MNISVFCGSQCGINPLYKQETIVLGQMLVKHEHTLIYGGGSIGLMGVLADEMLKQGGKVIGVLPRFFDMEKVGHKNITEMIFVNNMSERKMKMSAMSDAYIALPGGLGTLDEFFEMAVLSQLHLHEKPVGLLNINGFYNAQIEQLKTMIREGFLSKNHFELMVIAENVNDLLIQLENYTYSYSKKV